MRLQKTYTPHLHTHLSTGAERSISANTVDTDQTAPKEQSDQCLHCLPKFRQNILKYNHIIPEITVFKS